MSPDWQHLYETHDKNYWDEVDAKTAEAKEWGFPQSPEEFEKSPEGKLPLSPGVFWFAKRLNQLGANIGPCANSQSFWPPPTILRDSATRS